MFDYRHLATTLIRQEGARLLSKSPPPVALVIHEFGVAQFGNAAIARLYASITGGEFVDLKAAEAGKDGGV